MPISNFHAEQPISLYVIIVLYKCDIATSATCQSLLKQIGLEQQDIFVVYDNSPSANLGSTPKGWQVVLDPNNGGLLTAYNYAFSQARSKGCHWVLLLDQDTDLPANFVVTVHENLALMQSKTDVVAIIPIVKAGDRQVSPMLPRLGRETSYALRNVVESNWLTAINSGTCLRVDFIEGVGGFCKDFWLDYLDHWLFKTINSSRKCVYVTDVVLQHDLSVANMNSGLSVQRYKNVLLAERRFTNNYLPPIWRFVLIPRLLGRALKHLIMTRDKRLGCLMVVAAAAQLVSLAHIWSDDTRNV